MRQQRPLQFAPRWQRRATWLALVSLAWMQLAFAGHQFEHSPVYTDSCDACVQLDRLDDVVAGPPGALELLRPAGQEAILRCDTAARVAIVPAFNPRAPPVT
jgi:hypothetical protein